MLLASPHRPPDSEPRQWYRPARTAIPDEPGRLVLVALLNQARHARGCRTAGDDRIETRAYAVKRQIWRWAHAQSTGRFACSVMQLAQTLAPVLGWDPPPREQLERERWLRAKRKTIDRWLTDLQAAGVLSYEGERDNRGQWWRTIITLHEAPKPDDDYVTIARRRARDFKRRAARRRRARQRRRQLPPRRRLRRSYGPLDSVRERAVRPRRTTRRRIALQRSLTQHQVRRRRAVAAEIARIHHEKDQTHPFGAPPLGEHFTSSLDTAPRVDTPLQGSAARDSAQTSTSDGRSTDKTGARVRENLDSPSASQPFFDSTERARVEADETILSRVAARRAARAPFLTRAAAQALDRGRSVAESPSGAVWSMARLREAWVVFRFGATLRDDLHVPPPGPMSGPERVADHGSTDAGPKRPGLDQQAARAIATYEAHVAARPPGWPESGAAALCVLAATGRAATIAGDIARLRILATDMRAVLLHDDLGRLAAAKRRAEKRARPPAPPEGQLHMRWNRAQPPQPRRWETPELRRRRVRDELLRDGRHPGLDADVNRAGWEAAQRHDAGEPAHMDPAVYRLPDGMTARAHRYLAEVADGRWTLPPGWPLTP